MLCSQQGLGWVLATGCFRSSEGSREGPGLVAGGWVGAWALCEEWVNTQWHQLVGIFLPVPWNGISWGAFSHLFLVFGNCHCTEGACSARCSLARGAAPTSKQCGLELLPAVPALLASRSFAGSQQPWSQPARCHLLPSPARAEQGGLTGRKSSSLHSAQFGFSHDKAGGALLALWDPLPGRGLSGPSSVPRVHRHPQWHHHQLQRPAEIPGE